MKKINYKNVYQFKIILDDIKPPIWRRIQVPENYTFWDLHVAIQDAMGWTDSHLHQFRIASPKPSKTKYIGLPDEEDFGQETLKGWEEAISQWFGFDKNKIMRYDYDFGDNWGHKIILEKIFPGDGGKYPRCIDGARACPPEDCGGVGGYEDLLNIVKNPKHPEYKDMLEWLGGDFTVEEFDCKEVIFDSPTKRLREILKYNK